MDAEISGRLDAEVGVVGCLLIDTEHALDVVSARLLPSDFTSDLGRSVLQACTQMREEGEAIDPITLLARLGNGARERQYLLHCMEVLPTLHYVEGYCQELKRQSLCRELLEISDRFRGNLLLGREPHEAIGLLKSEIEGAGEQGGRLEFLDSSGQFQEFKKYLGEVSEGKKTAFVPTGYRTLDQIFGGGMVPEGLYILAARPGCGKTTLGLGIAERVANKGVPTLFISLEMSSRQLAAKRLACEAKLDSRRILSGALSSEELERLAEASARLSASPLYINKKPGANLAEIGALARSVKDIGFIVIDYLGLIAAMEAKKSRYEQVTELSGGLKRLARSMNLPVLCLAQLNRESERRYDKRPSTADLRDSGAIEQDADGIMLLQALGDEEGSRMEGAQKPVSERLICRVEKNRHGPTGRVEMNFYKSISRILEIRG